VTLDLNQLDIIMQKNLVSAKQRTTCIKILFDKKFLPKSCPGAVGFFMKHVMIRKWTEIKYSKKARGET
jgi:hypothetical protein